MMGTVKSFAVATWWRARSRLYAFFCFIFVFAVVIYLAVDNYIDYVDNWKLRKLQETWTGFEHEKGNYSFTVVTGLFDIGRGSWWTQSRSYNDYLGYLLQILKLDVNLIIFIEPKGQQFVKWARRGREHRTLLIVQEIKDLEYFPLLAQMTEIMNSEKFQTGNENYKKGKCEAVVPIYNLVTNSKITMMHQAIHMNPFQSKYFIWLDAGYGHGNASLYPQDGVWNPLHLTNHPEKVSFVALRNLSDKETGDIENLHKEDTAWIAGGLFAGGAQSMETFYALHKSIMNDYMIEGKIDDDQTTFSDCYFRQPTNFRPVLGSWYDLLTAST